MLELDPWETSCDEGRTSMVLQGSPCESVTGERAVQMGWRGWCEWARQGNLQGVEELGFRKHTLNM